MKMPDMCTLALFHEALNRVDAGMSVTDIYIERDWSVIWEANSRVLALFDWTAAGGGDSG
jgi:hypothetical protein